MNNKTIQFLQLVLLLIISNTFMTVAWYGHLKHKSKALLVVILLSWGIALFEYIFQVPANRIGSAQFSVTQLKIIQECISLSVFVVYAWVVFYEKIKWNTALALLLVIAAVYLALLGRE
jgi:hypothetical protein